MHFYSTFSFKINLMDNTLLSHWYYTTYKIFHRCKSAFLNNRIHIICHTFWNRFWTLEQCRFRYGGGGPPKVKNALTEQSSKEKNAIYTSPPQGILLGQLICWFYFTSSQDVVKEICLLGLKSKDSSLKSKLWKFHWNHLSLTWHQMSWSIWRKAVGQRGKIIYWDIWYTFSAISILKKPPPP